MTQRVHLAVVIEEPQVVSATGHVFVEPGEGRHHRAAVRSLRTHDHVHDPLQERGKAVWKLI